MGRHRRGLHPGARHPPRPGGGRGRPGQETGWVQGAQALALEYAGPGQDEAVLQEKIVDLLKAGTRLIWVVRLGGPRRVEIHAPGAPPRVVGGNDSLTAPGILRNPVPVAALYDREAARGVVLRNLLQGQGYASLGDVRLEGKTEGRREGEITGQAKAVLAILEGRGVPVTAAERARILDCIDLERLHVWLLRAGSVQTAAELFD